MHTKQRTQNSLVLLLGAIVLLLFLLRGGASFWASLLWMREIGYQSVLLTEIQTRIAIALAAGALTFAVLYGNLRLARARHRPVSSPRGDIELLTAGIRAGGLGGVWGTTVAALSAFIALIASTGWLAVLRLQHGSPFGVSEPLFGRDVGYYTFTLPVVAGGLALLVALVVLAGMLAAAFYAASGDIAVTGGVSVRGDIPVATPPGLRVSRAVGAHLAGLLVAYLVLSALQLWLVERPGLLFSGTGPLVGASYTDVHGSFPAFTSPRSPRSSPPRS